MTFCQGGICKDYTFPASRLWEVIERADARFGCTDGDPVRFQRAVRVNQRRGK